jgi:N-acetylglucosamine kinase-like BadF-type ATPase
LTYLGIDGGGTKTVFLLADAELRELDRTESGPSNWISAGNEAIVSIKDGISRLKHKPDIVCAGFAGAGRSESRAVYTRALQEALPDARIIVESDAFIAYIGAIGTGPGALLIAGTGSIAIGRSRNGKMVRVGGWGPQFGDEGGGFWIGREAVRAALALADRQEKNGFLDAVTSTLGLASIYDVVLAWQSGQVGVRQVAALFPEVTRFYPADPAGRILTEAALHLRNLAESAVRLVDSEGCTLSLSGSVARHPVIRNLIGLKFTEPVHAPERGAVMWAREEMTSGRIDSRH